MDVGDDQHNWPAWDSDKGQLPSGDEAGERMSGYLDDEQARAVSGELDEPTRALSEQLPQDATQVYASMPVAPRAYLPDDATQAIPPVRDDAPGLSIFDEPTVTGATAVGVYRADDEPPNEPGRRLRSGVGRAMMVTGAVLGVLVLAYAIDLLVSWGDVPRGVTVAGVDVGGMARADAEQKLRRDLQPRFDQPVKITAGDVRSTLNPTESGLGVDWQATLEQAGQQPWSPITRLASFWSEREVGIVGKSDEPTLKKAVQKLASEEINHRKREGDITFKDVEGGEGAVTPVAVQPRQGQQLGPIEDAMVTIED
ncbi:MAG: hypothetical protein ACRDQF_13955, partial [Thermocrispum sp.]